MHRGCADAISAGQRRSGVACCISGADFEHQRLGEYRTAVACAALVTARVETLAGNGIVHIQQGVAGPHMRGVAASAIGNVSGGVAGVAGVAECLAFGDGAVGQFPRHSVGKRRFAVSCAVDAVAYDAPVPVRETAVFPEPAVVRASFSYVLPEAGRKRFRWSSNAFHIKSITDDRTPYQRECA